MKNKNVYQPPFSVTPAILRLIADIGEALGRAAEKEERAVDLRLRRINRICTIQGSLAIERNALSETFAPQVAPQVTPQVERLLAVPALQAGFIEMTVPDKPGSRFQRYRLTLKGQRLRTLREPEEKTP